MLETQIEEAKKFNDDLKRERNFGRIKDLRRELRRKNFHDCIIEKISDIFMFEQRKRNGGKNKEVPTKKSAELLNESAELLGLLLRAFDIKTSQIRRYLDSLRRIKTDTSRDSFNASSVLLQQVKIAYAAGRKPELDFLYEVMKPAITEGSRGYEYFEQLLRMVEAIVAYHKYYGGGD
jgi:CRISPR-associated protein Csm2